MIGVLLINIEASEGDAKVFTSSLYRWLDFCDTTSHEMVEVT